MVIHTVQPGDSLYRIAQMHGVPLPFLIQQNELREPYRLTPGQAIVVPQPTQTYTVKRGDTLGDIAARNGTTVLALWQNNPQLGGTDRIYPGQSLVLSYGPKLGTFAVNGYAYPNIDVRVLRKTLPYLTYLSIFSYGFDSMGRLLPQNADLLTRMARQYGVRPLLVLTTLGEDGQFSGERAHRLFQDTASRSALVENLAQTLAAQGFAGVDIDFEFVPPEDAAAYAAFVRDVRARLEPAGYTVLVALAPKTSAGQRGLLYEAHDYRAMGAAADYVLLMTYEWGYALSEPMAVAPLDKVAQVVRYATRPKRSSWVSRTTAMTGRCPLSAASRVPGRSGTCRPLSRRSKSAHPSSTTKRHSRRTTTTGATGPSMRCGLRTHARSAPSWRSRANTGCTG